MKISLSILFSALLLTSCNDPQKSIVDKNPLKHNQRRAQSTEALVGGGVDSLALFFWPNEVSWHRVDSPYKANEILSEKLASITQGVLENSREFDEKVLADREVFKPYEAKTLKEIETLKLERESDPKIKEIQIQLDKLKIEHQDLSDRWIFDCWEDRDTAPECEVIDDQLKALEKQMNGLNAEMTLIAADYDKTIASKYKSIEDLKVQNGLDGDWQARIYAKIRKLIDENYLENSKRKNWLAGDRGLSTFGFEWRDKEKKDCLNANLKIEEKLLLPRVVRTCKSGRWEYRTISKETDLTFNTEKNGPVNTDAGNLLCFNKKALYLFEANYYNDEYCSSEFENKDQLVPAEITNVYYRLNDVLTFDIVLGNNKKVRLELNQSVFAGLNRFAGDLEYLDNEVIIRRGAAKFDILINK